MSAIGVFSDSHGDLGAFDAAYELLREKGARRFIFAGGRYADLDQWIMFRTELARGGRDYSDQDFLSDVTRFLAAQAGRTEEQHIWTGVKDRFVRTPEKECLQYSD